MKFLTAVLLVLTVAAAARAIHPPMGPTPTPGGNSPPPVTITSVTPTIDTAPEPSGATLAILGVVGGYSVRLWRRRNRQPVT